MIKVHTVEVKLRFNIIAVDAEVAAEGIRQTVVGLCMKNAFEQGTSVDDSSVDVIAVRNYE